MPSASPIAAHDGLIAAFSSSEHARRAWNHPPRSADPARVCGVRGPGRVESLPESEDWLQGGYSNPDRSEYDITYTVNPDCSGTYTVPLAGASFGLFVAPDGEEVIVIGTAPGFVLVQGPNKRVSPK